MILQDERFACAAVSVERRYLKFDDIGCLAEHEKEQAARDLRSWVRDADTGWVAKEQAHFVYFKDLVTPMGFGFAAFASAESAEKFAKDKGGRVISWNEILSLNQGENLQPEEAK
jgi:copper chaperone NosL